jgi:hypothetical protein
MRVCSLPHKLGAFAAGSCSLAWNSGSPALLRPSPKQSTITQQNYSTTITITTGTGTIETITF